MIVFGFRTYFECPASNGNLLHFGSAVAPLNPLRHGATRAKMAASGPRFLMTPFPPRHAQARSLQQHKPSAVFVLSSTQVRAPRRLSAAARTRNRYSNRTDLQTAAMGAGPSTEGEREPLLTPTSATTNGQPVHSRVYGRRWLVLCLFSLLGFMQGMIWNFWGPIQNSAVHAFGFSKSDIAVLVLWGPVGFIPWLLFMWLMDKKGEFGTPCPVFACCVCLVVFSPRFILHRL